jgi:hypothetical protein
MKAEDFEDGDIVVTIRDESPVEWAEFTQKGKPTPDNKPVLYFRHPRDAKALVLNKTNWKTINEVLGSDETDDWAGKQITLYATEVESFGETVLAIRVRLKKPIKTQKPSGDSDADGADRFWKTVNASGINREDAKPIAAKAAAGETTWEQAIESLPASKSFSTDKTGRTISPPIDESNIPF